MNIYEKTKKRRREEALIRPYALDHILADTFKLWQASTLYDEIENIKTKTFLSAKD